MAKQPPSKPADDETPPWETGGKFIPTIEPMAGQDITTDPVQTPGTAVVGGQLDGWAADDEPEVPEVDPRFRREQLERLRGQVAQPEGGFTITAGGPATTLLLRALEYEGRTVDDGNAAVYEDIFARIQDASTAEDIFADDEPLDAEDVLGQALQVWDVSVVKSDYAEGLRWYVAIKARRVIDNENVVVTCGATKVVAQLMQAKAHKLLPVVVKFVRKERATRAGMHPISLVLVK